MRRLKQLYSVREKKKLRLCVVIQYARWKYWI